MVAGAPIANRNSRAAALILFVVVVATLYFAREVLIPLALAILLSFLLAPLVLRLQRWHIPRVAAVIISVLMTLVLVGAIATLVAAQFTDLADNLPRYSASIRAKGDTLRNMIGHTVNRASRTVEVIAAPATQAGVDAVEEHPAAVRIVGTPPKTLESVRAIVTPFLSPLIHSGIVLVLVIFILLQREDLRDRFIRLVSGGQISVTTEALNDAASRVSRYLLMQSIINLIQGVVIAIGLYFIGVPNAPLWGLLAALLRFVPYLGVWIAASMPIILSLGVFDGWTQPLLVAGLFLMVELLCGNAIEPWLYGAGTGMSTLAVILSAILWTWLWGAVGLVLAVPLTVCLVVIGKYVPQFQFFAILLGDQPVLDAGTRFYQRLIALDRDAAAEVLESELRKNEDDLARTYDEVLIGALVQAGRDRHSGALDESRAASAYDALRDILIERGEEEEKRALDAAAKNSAVNGADPGAVCALCFPARDEADELAGMMLAQVASRQRVCLEPMKSGTLAAEAVEIALQRGAHVAVVSALPPFGLTHARYLTKRLLNANPELTVLIGLWASTAPADKTEKRLGVTDNVKLSFALRTAADALRQAVSPVLLRQASQNGDSPARLATMTAG